MPEVLIDTVKTFTFEGRFAVSTLAVVGVFVAIVFTILAWKERRYATRPGMLPMLLGLRLVVLGLVLWALAGPTDVVREKRMTPKGFGIFVDGSASMTIEDIGDGTGNVARWRDAASTSEPETVRLLLDKALGALLASQSGVRGFVANAEKTGNAGAEERGGRLLGNARLAIEACVGFFEKIDAGAAEFQHLESGRFIETARLVKEEITPRVRALAASDTSEQSDFLEELERLFSMAASSFRSLADAVYGRYEESFATATRGDAAALRVGQVMPWIEELEEDWIAPQEDSVRISRFAFASEPIPVARDAWRKHLVDQPASAEAGTNLGSALQQALKEAAAGRLHGAIIVTDGAHNVGRGPMEIAPALSDIPVVLVPTGDARLRRDLFLHHVQYPKSVMKKDILSIDAMVGAHDCEGESVTVDLLDDKEKVIDSQSIRIRQSVEDHSINLKWHADELGLREFQLRIRPVEDEFTEENNSKTIRVRAVDNEMRVFLADDLPRWEFRYLLNLFKRDPKVISESALFSPGHVYPGRTPRPAPARLPKTQDEWNRFRVVILGDLTEKQLTPAHQKRLAKYLVEGGNLVVIAGDNAMPQKYFGTEFGDLLPVDYRPLPRDAAVKGHLLSVTPEGRDAAPVQIGSTIPTSLWLWNSISKSLPVYDLSPCSEPKPTANVLIEALPVGSRRAGGRAFLSWQYVGRGRVVYVAAPAIHKLRYRYGDRYHYRFWGQMLRWIVGRDLAGSSKTVRLTTDKMRYPSGAAVQTTLRLNQLDGKPVSGAEPELVARLGDRVVSRIVMEPDKSAPGQYHAVLAGLPSGNIRLEPKSPRIDTLLRREKYTDPVGVEVAVEPHDSMELRNPLCDMSLLGSIADAGSGVQLSPTAAREFLRYLDLAPTVEERNEREPLWAEWWLLLTVCALLLAEWIGRKFSGLV